MALFKFTKLKLAGESFQVFNCGKHCHDFICIADIFEGFIRVLHQPAGVVEKAIKSCVAWYRNEFELI